MGGRELWRAPGEASLHKCNSLQPIAGGCERSVRQQHAGRLNAQTGTPGVADTWLTAQYRFLGFPNCTGALARVHVCRGAGPAAARHPQAHPQLRAVQRAAKDWGGFCRCKGGAHVPAACYSTQWPRVCGQMRPRVSWLNCCSAICPASTAPLHCCSTPWPRALSAACRALQATRSARPPTAR